MGRYKPLGLGLSQDPPDLSGRLLMDVKRIVLLISLALVSYLMVLQWNQDYHSPAPSVATSAPAPSVATASSDAVEDERLHLGEAPIQAAQAASPQALIQVTTDVLDLRINPRGGDITYAALLQHKQRANTPDQPFVLLQQDSQRTYIVQSALEGLANRGRIQFQASQSQYQLQEGQESLQLDLAANIDGIPVVKRFVFQRDSYEVKVSYLLDNTSTQALETRFIGLIKRDNSVDPSQGEALGMSAFLGAAFSSEENHYEKLEFDELRERRYLSEVQGGWVAMIQHYFVSAWIPNAQQTNLYSTRTDNQGRNIIGFKGAAQRIEAGQQAEISANLYLGPKIQSRLEAAAPYLELTVDFGWLWFIAQPLFWLLDLLHDFLGNWGWAIIVLTLLIKLAFFQLSATAYRSMANMRKVGPKLQQLKEQYGDDRQKMSQAMMELYRKEKINPMGGCLPILVQMPVFIALYWMLMESVELRHAPFMLWIDDLSMKDPYFVLPILMGASMFVQQLLNPTPPDPMQAKIMKMLPIIFTFFFLWFPSGLVLYWVVNNVLSIAQQWVITRQIEQGTS